MLPIEAPGGGADSSGTAGLYTCQKSPSAFPNSTATILSAALFRIDIHHATFALFLGEAIHDEDLLAEFYTRLHIEQAAI